MGMAILLLPFHICNQVVDHLLVPQTLHCWWTFVSRPSSLRNFYALISSCQVRGKESKKVGSAWISCLSFAWFSLYYIQELTGLFSLLLWTYCGLESWSGSLLMYNPPSQGPSWSQNLGHAGLLEKPYFSLSLAWHFCPCVLPPSPPENVKLQYWSLESLCCLQIIYFQT